MKERRHCICHMTLDDESIAISVSEGLKEAGTDYILSLNSDCKKDNHIINIFAKCENCKACKEFENCKKCMNLEEDDRQFYVFKDKILTQVPWIEIHKSEVEDLKYGMLDTKSGHIYEYHKNCRDDSHCYICDGGLGVCLNCGQAECDLEKKCPQELPAQTLPNICKYCHWFETELGCFMNVNGERVFSAICYKTRIRQLNTHTCKDMRHHKDFKYLTIEEISEKKKSERDLSLPKVHPTYGGVLTYYEDLPVGTTFKNVCANWEGSIVEEFGVRKIVTKNRSVTMTIIPSMYNWLEMITVLKEEPIKCGKGIATRISELPIGTSFYVISGNWYGEIISENGVKELLMRNGNKHDLTNDTNTLEIEILETQPRAF